MGRAFAFRDFDEARILSRPFFKEYNLKGTDEEILKALDVAAGDTIDDMEEKLRRIKSLHERLIKFQQLIRRHTETRLDAYNKSKAKAAGVKVGELTHPAPTLEYVTAQLSAAELQSGFAKAYVELEKKIQKRYREEFAARLKKARKQAGLSQKELGDMIQIKLTTFSQYETAKRDPSIPTICRLLKVLPANQILGLKT